MLKERLQRELSFSYRCVESIFKNLFEFFARLREKHSGFLERIIVLDIRSSILPEADKGMELEREAVGEDIRSYVSILLKGNSVTIRLMW